ncbi:hypothetical protein [Asanoa sp. NPDC050611]|uniref:hypothetical protein n=1 Tax=Asanoa sp. NPDC050611 TaxID=3157098 RepID=UPI003401FDF3
MQSLGSVRARVTPDHGFVIVLGTGYQKPFLPDFREGRLCYASDDILYLMSAIGWAHDDEVILEAWPGQPPPDPAAERSDTTNMVLSEGRIYVSRLMEAAVSPVLTAGSPGPYHVRVEVTGRAAVATYYEDRTPGDPHALEQMRVHLWPASVGETLVDDDGAKA